MKKKLPIFTYEDFCRKPSKVVLDICKYTGLEYSDSYRNYISFLKVNGDIQIAGGSRGTRQGKIKLLPRKHLSEDKIIEVNQNADMVRANSLLGYPVSYYDFPWENIWIKRTKTAMSKISRKLAKLW